MMIPEVSHAECKPSSVSRIYQFLSDLIAEPCDAPKNGIMTEIDGQSVGGQFDFGSNWRDFSKLVDDARVEAAVDHIKELLRVQTLHGLTFLDVGSGSGLSSLAARRLGAVVHSFDFDFGSVACTEQLRRRTYPEDPNWTVKQGSILDTTFVASLRQYDVVHAWGVLHHTGAMWLALEQSIRLVAPGGLLYIAIYNDQGYKSRCWWLFKYGYGKLPNLMRPAFVRTTAFAVRCAKIVRNAILRRSVSTVGSSVSPGTRKRGMSAAHDLVDWIGGFPYEYVSYGVLRAYLELRGLAVENARPTASLGCHEVVCRRLDDGRV